MKVIKYLIDHLNKPFFDTISEQKQGQSTRFWFWHHVGLDRKISLGFITELPLISDHKSGNSGNEHIITDYQIASSYYRIIHKPSNIPREVAKSQL